MLGNSLILYDRTVLLNKLNEYTLDVYKTGFPKLDNEDIMEYISIINNRILMTNIEKNILLENL